MLLYGVMHVIRSDYYRVKNPLTAKALENKRLLGVLKHYWLASMLYSIILKCFIVLKGVMHTMGALLLLSMKRDIFGV